MQGVLHQSSLNTVCGFRHVILAARSVVFLSGNGGLPHLASELLNNLAGIKAVHVPYKGSAPGFNDLLGGQVQFGFDAVPKRLHGEIVRAMNIPELREKLIAQGTDPVDSNPKTFGIFMKAESAKWARVIKDANIKAD